MKAGGASPAVLAAALLLLALGFGLKAGVFPLGQLWLPDAHSVAPSPVSALLSGVMLKTGIFGLIRVFFFLAPAAGARFDARPWGAALAAVGVLTLFIGTLQSVKQSDAKRLLAYSSIGQIGYIVLGLGAALLLSASEDPLMQGLAAVAVLGALLHLLNHAVFKGLLFLTGGSLLYATGTKDLNRLGGLVRWMPVSAVLAAIASLAIAGMPPGSGFASKWTIVASTLLAGSGWTLLVPFGIIALFTSTVTLACYVKFFGLSFTASGAEASAGKPIREVPGSMLAAKAGLGPDLPGAGLGAFPFRPSHRRGPGAFGRVPPGLDVRDGRLGPGSRSLGFRLADRQAVRPGLRRGRLAHPGSGRPAAASAPGRLASPLGGLDRAVRPDLAVRLPEPGRADPFHRSRDVRRPEDISSAGRAAGLRPRIER